MRLKNLLLTTLFAAMVSACGGGTETGALLNPDNLGGGSGSGSGGTASVLTITGPNSAPSGALEVEAGSLTGGFVATLTSASGQPVASRFISLRPQRGFVNAPPSRANSGGANTNTAGQVPFAYQAPEDITRRTVVPIVASVASTTSGGTPIEQTYELAVIPAPPPVITLTCPANSAPGIANSGFAALVEKQNGQQVAKACITLTASGGTISPPPSTTCTNGSAGVETDDAGRFNFTFTPPASVAQDTVLTITAATTVAGQSVSKSCQTTARADTFQFTSPKTGTPIVVGSETREPLRFQWTRSPQTAGGAQGVGGTLQLSITGGGRLVFNDDPFSESQSISVTTSAANNGDFERPVSVFSNNSGQSTITAREQTTGRTTNVIVQFVDTPGEINLDANPLVVQTSPNNGRFSNLVVTVLNQAGAPITGVDVDFILVSSASGNVNERVFPQRQTTDASGQAKSRYEAGPTAGTAQVQVRVEGGGLSNLREITVAAPTP